MGEPRIKDLYLHTHADYHGVRLVDGVVVHGCQELHPGIVLAHNALVEMVLSLRERVGELEKWQEKQSRLST